MSEMLLLGAGASADAGVPTAYRMTKEMLDVFQSKFPRTHRKILSFVIGGLLFQLSRKGENPLSSGVNIEDLFNAVQLLAQRHTLEAAPFVGSWDYMVEEFDRPQATSSNVDAAIYKSVANKISKAFSRTPLFNAGSDIDRTFNEAVKVAVTALSKKQSAYYSSYSSLGKSVTEYFKKMTDRWISELNSSFGIGDSAGRAIEDTFKQTTGRGKGRIFEKTNYYMIAALKDLVWISEDEKLKYLGPILNLLDRQNRLVIATLNYDNTIELLCNSQEKTCTTGIEEWSNTGGFNCEGEGIHLLKMHGSIDWQKTHKGEKDNKSFMPQVVVQQIPSNMVSESSFSPAVIFGQRNKLTADGPFLDLLRAFQKELSRTTILTVIGYSFKDAHINSYISQWLNQDNQRKLQIINGKSFVNDESDYVMSLRHYEQQHKGVVTFIPQYAEEGLRGLYGEYSGRFEKTDLPKQSAVEKAVTSKNVKSSAGDEVVETTS